MPVTRFSRQREAIRLYLENTKSHPTAEKIYQHIKCIYPNISLGTVYRNLNQMYEKGEILKLKCEDMSEHFDADTSTHYHLFCRKCHELVDLKMESIQHINTIAAADFDGKIESHFTYFTGLCPKCNHTK